MHMPNTIAGLSEMSGTVIVLMKYAINSHFSYGRLYHVEHQFAILIYNPLHLFIFILNSSEDGVRGK